MQQPKAQPQREGAVPCKEGDPFKTTKQAQIKLQLFPLLIILNYFSWMFLKKVVL